MHPLLPWPSLLQEARLPDTALKARPLVTGGWKCQAQGGRLEEHGMGLVGFKGLTSC